jgi:PAS domain S-box-containing protein
VVALSESEQQYREIFEATSDGLFITDLETGIVLEANPAACRMHGYESMVGLHPTDFIHPNSHHLLDGYVAAVRAGREFRSQAHGIRRDGSIIDVEAIGRSFIYQGRPAILGVVRDVTENARAYQLLEQRVDERTREIQRRRMVAEGLRDLLAAVNSRRTLDEILIYVVEQSRRLLGSDAAAICLPADDPDGLVFLIHASSGLKEELTNVRLPAGGSSTGLAFTRLRPVVVADVRAALPSPAGDGQELELDEHADYIKVLRLPARLDHPSVVGYGERPPALRTFAREFGALLAVPLAIKGEAYGTLALYYREPRDFDTDDVRLASAFADQTALALENARLREQAEQAAVLVERQRLARDLHDAVTQTLFSASLFADVIPQLWEVDQAEARSRLQQLRTLTRGALAEMRLLLVELRPSTLTELSLTDLLRQLGDATAGNSGAEVSVQIYGPGPTRLAPDVHVALYRIAQEALHNIVKHARAGRVSIMLSYRLNGVTLEITDDGRGFDLDNTPAGHLGVSIMRERAEAIGARYRLVSSPTAGTCITVDWINAEELDA